MISLILCSAGQVRMDPRRNDGEMPPDLGFCLPEMMPWGHFRVPLAWAKEGERGGDEEGGISGGAWLTLTHRSGASWTHH